MSALKARRRLYEASVMSSPANDTFPSLIGVRPRMARPIVVLPEPDSPTSPTVSCVATVRDTPATARTGGRLQPREKSTVSPVTSRRLSFSLMRTSLRVLCSGCNASHAWALVVRVGLASYHTGSSRIRTEGGSDSRPAIHQVVGRHQGSPVVTRRWALDVDLRRAAPWCTDSLAPEIGRSRSRARRPGPHTSRSHDRTDPR